jgi:two-component system C4-dicarboxylate transport sensor histidine kinase DctB
MILQEPDTPRSRLAPAELACPPPRRVGHFGALAGAVLLAACALAAAVAAHEGVLRWLQAEENEQAAGRLGFYAGVLEAELARVEALPALLALDPRLGAALNPRAPAAARDEANELLAKASQRSGVDAVFLMDPTGLTLAASNHGQSGSFVGQYYGFRPYFREAMQGQLGRYYAVGPTPARPGYFLAHRVEGTAARDTGAAEAVAGVVVVKATLQRLEGLLEASGDTLMLADQAGVVFLASSAALRYRLLSPLSEEARRAIIASRQYGPAALTPLVPGVDLLAQPRVPPPVSGDTLGWEKREVIHRAVGPLGWRLVTLAQTPRSHRAAALAALAAALGVTSSWLALWHHRRVRARRAELLSLEIEVRQRIAGSTRELSQRLDSQQDALLALRRSSDAAVQTGKLAVLGQMSVALSHELNQPITALMNQADSAATLMARGLTQEAEASIVQIRTLARRMADILGHLRDHARRDSGVQSPTDVRQCLQAALSLVDVHGGQHTGDVRVLPPLGNQPYMTLAEPVRLEQVFVNLIRNAVEAARNSVLGGRVQLLLLREGGTIIVEVHDNGPGLSSEAKARLFEPFYTTKPPGAGLGLGLAVSRMIVEGMGGRLQARNGLTGGAVFSVRLPHVGD